MKIYHPSLRSTKIGSSRGLVSVDAEGYAEVSDELGAHLLKIDFVLARGTKVEGVAPVKAEPAKVTFAPMVEEKMLTSETEVPESLPPQQAMTIPEMLNETKVPEGTSFNKAFEDTGTIITPPQPDSLLSSEATPEEAAVNQAVIDEINRISVVQPPLMVSISPSAEAVQAAFEKATQSGSPTAVVETVSRETTPEEMEAVRAILEKGGAFISLTGEEVQEVERKTIHEGLVGLLTKYLEQTKVKPSSISKVAERLLGLLEGNEEVTPDQADEPEAEDPDALQKLRLRHASIAAALRKPLPPKKPAKK